MDVALARERASVRILATVLVAIVVVMHVTLPAQETPYLFVDQAVAARTELADRVVRVHGYVRPGSILRLDSIHAFELTWRGARLPAWVVGPIPDTFRDDAEVIVEGRLLRPGWILQGTSVMAKCAIKYDGDGGNRLDATFR